MNPIEYILLQWVNLVILLIILTLLLKKSAREFLYGRKERIRLFLEKAAKDYRDMQNKYQQAKKKDAAANKDAENLKSSIIETGNFRSDALIKEAKNTAERIKKEADARATHNLQKAKELIAREILELSFDRAGKILKEGIAEEKQIVLVDSSLNALKNIRLSE